MRDYDDDRPQSRNSNELILNPGEYAFLQDKAKGTVQTVVGPDVVTQSGQLRPIQYREGRFTETSLQGAVEQCVVAAKGEYVVLHNPSEDQDGLHHPGVGTANGSVPTLRHGEKIVVPGPCQFALWPEQEAEVVAGHDLRDDQFLIVRVYDQDAAVANWSDAVVEVSETEDEDSTTVATQTAEELGLTLGKLLIIKGVSFYIPPTGVEVAVNDDGEYVRDALTLEMSEYAILVDQSGNKRYERGPQIVFPEPTESFFKDGAGLIKFRPIELTPTQGLHLKVNCDYTDPAWPTESGTTTSRAFTEGEEVFITGATHPIYYPCEEHSIVRYGDNLIHYATAVPAGQGRYVLDKNTGEHRLIQGPDMVLLDPTKDVFLTRALSDNETLLMYPGNTDSLEYNRQLRSFQVGDEAITTSALEASYEDFEDYGHEVKTLGAVTRSAGGPRKKLAGSAALPDQLRRRTSYTEPHSVTLDDNRFKGVPTLRIWTGFAVLLVKADGTRRVEVGPKTVMLDYDETVQALHLSTGKPKTTDKLVTTGYLEVSNNKVSDIITVETEDGVKVQIKVSYRVSFTGDPKQWFNVDNYVKFLCDNARSRLKGAARHHSVRDFYNNTVDIVRDTILGEKIDDEDRDGLLFTENGMHVTEVDLLDVNISDPTIAGMLVEQQQAVVTDEIEIDRANQQLKVTTATQKVEKEKLALAEELRVAKHELELAKFANQVELADLRAADQFQRAEEATKLAGESEKAKQVEWDADIARHEQKQALEIANASAATDEIVKRFKAAEGDLASAINRLGDEELLAKVAEAMGPMRLIGGGSLTDVISGVIGAVGGNNELVNRLNTLVDTQAGS